MALTTYGGLKTAVALTLNRTDLTSVIPDFVALAEEDIANDVRVRAMEEITTGTLTGETLAHPSRFLSVRRFTVGGYVYEYVTPEKYQDIQEAESDWKVYTSIGSNFHINDAASGDAYSIIYTTHFAAFSADGDTNWLLTNAPGVYLYGACKHASIYLKDDADLAKYAALYTAAVKRIVEREREAAFGGRLQVRSTTYYGV